MVSKVAVIALVAVISVPILLGYALNLTEVTETDYRSSGDSVNVTPLLLNDTWYTSAHGNAYQLNTNVNMAGIKSLPLYESRLMGTATTLFSRIFFNTALENTDYDMSVDYNWGINIFDSTSTRYLRVAVYYVDENNIQQHYSSYNNVINGSYDDQTKTLRLSYINSAGGYSDVRTMTYTNDHIILKFTHVGGFDANASGIAWGASKSDNPQNFYGYVDFSAGFRLLDHNQTVNQPYVWTTTPASSIILPQDSKTALITMDLDSITDPSYSLLIGNPLFYLNKSTDGEGIVSWQIVDYYDPTNTVDLYYNQSGNNTYQIYLYTDNDATPTGTPGYFHYTEHAEFRYVGIWPSLIGEANYYKTFDYSWQITDDKYPQVNGTLGFQGASKTPIMRVDDAEYRAFEYQVINENVYDPAVFKNNPSTKIANVDLFGTSLTFGGNTYTVRNGNISLSGHDIPVEGLILSSIDNGDGTYDNKIGNTVISTTAQPSTISFNGKWSASVSTDSMESYTYTKTEWKAGSFAWDGMDQNFLIVGLITCLGVFVALGIYARKSRSGGIIPLMIVTGCAAAVFFIML